MSTILEDQLATMTGDPHCFELGPDFFVGEVFLFPFEASRVPWHGLRDVLHVDGLKVNKIDGNIS